jgi:Mg-chelatase subunit ChlI
MNSSLVKSLYFRVFGRKCFILVKRGRKSKFAPKAVEGFLLGSDSNTRAYRVFNKSTRLVEVSCDIVFDETNGSQVEQVDLDELDDEEAPCVALRNMSIRDVCPKESREPPQAQDQSSSSNQASPPTQDEDQAQDNEDEDQENEPPQEEDKCRRFETGGSLSRRVSVLRALAQMGRVRGRARRGERRGGRSRA